MRFSLRTLLSVILLVATFFGLRHASRIPYRANLIPPCMAALTAAVVVGNGRRSTPSVPAMLWSGVAASLAAMILFADECYDEPALWKRTGTIFYLIGRPFIIHSLAGALLGAAIEAAVDRRPGRVDSGA